MDKSWIWKGQYLDIEDISWTKVESGHSQDKTWTYVGHFLDLDKAWTKPGSLTSSTSTDNFSVLQGVQMFFPNSMPKTFSVGHTAPTAAFVRPARRQAQCPHSVRGQGVDSVRTRVRAPVHPRVRA